MICMIQFLIKSFLWQEVIRLEALCKELYESQDAAARAEAEKALVSFQVPSAPLFFGLF